MTFKINKAIFTDIKSIKIFSVFIFFLILFLYFIFWPVVAYDTDLWYHLNGGRYFWENAHIARDAFFSYVFPQKDWYNYYWLFQVIVYPIHSLSGYYGLIVLRCILFVLTALFIFMFFYRRHQGQVATVVSLCVFAAYPLALTLRELLIRPHLFSYLFIVVFLYILEVKRAKIWLLPVLGVLWCNIHGIEYPVMMLILLAYLTEMYYADFRKNSSIPRGTKFQKWLMIATLYTVFLTPQFIELVKIPFSVTYGNALHQHMYISELIPLELSDLFRFSFFPASDFLMSLRNILVLTGIFCFCVCLFKRNLRLSHAIIFAASLLLLFKHGRFSYEFILLSLPMIRHCIDLIPVRRDTEKISKPSFACFLLPVALIIVPFWAYQSHFQYRPEYPVSQLKIPVGVAEFLNQHGSGGNILNEPNTGGYLQWALKDEYKIYMDMQLSLFSDLDFAFASSALQDKYSFDLFVQQYDPSFVSVSLANTGFIEFIKKYKQFQLIFFDDVEALFANSQKHPELAEKFNLKEINPFRYKDIHYEKESKERLKGVLTEAKRILDVHPGCGMANMMIANVLMANGEYEQALNYADAVIRHYPNTSTGYALKGDALRAMEQVEGAIEQYEAAIRRGLKPEDAKVYWNLHTCYGHQKKYKKAYKVLSKFVNPYHPEANYKDIYALAVTAAHAGKRRDAVNFLNIARFKVPPDDAEYSKKISDHLVALDPKRKRSY